MDTHLTPLNEDVVREREDAMRAARERAETLFAQRRSDAGTSTLAPCTATGPGDRADADGRHQVGIPLDLVVVTLFAVLAAGFVSLVVTTLHIG